MINKLLDVLVALALLVITILSAVQEHWQEATFFAVCILVWDGRTRWDGRR